MYLKYLRYFITVAEYRNFSRAAEKLNTVQPSISRQIKKLEEIIGTPLFIRSPHELELTQSGEVFLEHAKLILRQFEQAKSQALEAAMVAGNKINVGLFSGTEQPFFDKVLIPAKKKYPDLSVNLMSKNEVELVENVKDGTLDVGFLIGPVLDPNLNYHPVCKQKVAVAIAETDPLASKEKVNLQDLTNMPLYLPKDEDSPFYKSALRHLLSHFAPEHLNSSIFCDSAMSAMQSICMNEGGCCFVFDFQAYFAPNNVVIKELDTENGLFNVDHELVLITSQQSPSSSALKLIHELN
ncbi:LysR family transcriptional regulator [Vibrio sp. HA2012]|uniref:LysR family transcriptional regulator n=1 Tax=Vibrio sp. HA2012 TaxID=1971595 RepID=UPI0018E1EB41|nr:LysR family transcriptional regulator [Vibrio sp. HA2012]